MQPLPNLSMSRDEHQGELVEERRLLKEEWTDAAVLPLPAVRSSPSLLIRHSEFMMEGEDEDSLDLSHLTEGEQAAILEVLLRDSELRRRDEGRVSRTLQQREADPMRLRTLTGDWFNDERSKRHLDRKQGCDLVHASIRRRKTRSADVPLSELFNTPSEAGRPMTPQNNRSPQTEGREEEEEEQKKKGRSQERVAPIPTPRTQSPHSQSRQDGSSISSSAEFTSRGNGYSEERGQRMDGSDGDTDSVSSDVTELDPTSLGPSSSMGNLQSNTGGSMMSLFSSGEFGAVEVKGRILMALAYDAKGEELQIQVCRCEDLAPARKNLSDPYVKAYLLPDKSSHSKKKTSVKKKTLNPVYDQTLKYNLRMGELRGRTLNLSVWHAVPMGRNLFLGEVELGLGVWDWSTTQPVWHHLQPRVQLSPDSISSRGMMLLSIKFTPAGSEGGGLPLTGELHVWLREAQGLLSTRGGAVDSYIKSYVLPDASQSSGQKTRLIKRSISPIYNHTMVYDGFQPADLREACTELIVWQREGLKTYQLGGVRLSLGTGQSYGENVLWMDSTEQEVSVWSSMIQNPSHWIDTTLPIRTNLKPRPD